MLYFKEIKKVAFSITFAVLVFALITMSVSQDVLNFSDMIITEPQPGENYGIQAKEIPEQIMPAAFDSLCKEFTANKYIAYPIGFYKTVKLGEKDRENMAEIISALSGVPTDNILGYRTEASSKDKIEITLDNAQNYTAQDDGSIIINNNNVASDSEAPTELTLKADISYETFKAYMKKADDLIGGCSRYSESSLLQFGYVAITYDEAAEEYNNILAYDHFTGAYARLFCDYIGVFISILPVFISVALCLKDRRSRMNDLIYVRRISSFKLLFTRFFAMATVIFIPTIILAYISNISVWSSYSGMALDYLAPLKYVLGWLMPSVMISTAVGMFFTEITNTPIAIVIQGLWWFIDINVGARKTSAGYALFQLTPRHNSLGNTQTFIDGYDTLVTNRVLFAVAALVLVIASAVVYELKRRGNLYGTEKARKTISDFTNNENESAA